jgi:hypothetical protein
MTLSASNHDPNKTYRLSTVGGSIVCLSGGDYPVSTALGSFVTLSPVTSASMAHADKCSLCGFVSITKKLLQLGYCFIKTQAIDVVTLRCLITSERAW